MKRWLNSKEVWQKNKAKLTKLTANWLVNKLLTLVYKGGKDLNACQEITPENFAELITLVYQDKINSSAAQKIIAVMYKNGGDPTSIMADLGLEQLDDETELESVVASILAENQAQADEYRAGKENVDDAP